MSSEEGSGALPGYRTIGDVVRDPRFSQADVALRKGRHIGLEDVELYAFLEEARPLLDEFYGAYGWDLAAEDAGFYFLLPRGELGGAELSTNAMLVGQGCLLLKLDPQTVRSHQRVSRAQLLELLGAVVGEEELARRLTGAKDRRETRRIELVHQKLGGALTELHRLGFLEVRGEEIVLRSALVRFAEPVRGDGDWRQRLPDLVRRGYVVIEGSESDDEPLAESLGEDEADEEDASEEDASEEDVDEEDLDESGDEVEGESGDSDEADDADEVEA